MAAAADEGMRRQFDIPASLAYGDAGIEGVIPGGAAISFVVDIVSVEKPPPPPLSPALARRMMNSS